MKSICYVVLPDNLPLNDDDVYKFVRKHILKYYSELEIEPYKKFFTEKETLDIAKRKGFYSVADFEKHLIMHNDDDGIENGLYYWITTYNYQGRRDSIRLDGIMQGHQLEKFEPYSIVTPDGVWHSAMDYGYIPKLDFESGGQHPDNIESGNKWRSYLKDFFDQYKNKNLAIIHVHS